MSDSDEESARNYLNLYLNCAYILYLYLCLYLCLNLCFYFGIFALRDAGGKALGISADNEASVRNYLSSSSCLSSDFMPLECRLIPDTELLCSDVFVFIYVFVFE